MEEEDEIVNPSAHRVGTSRQVRSLKYALRNTADHMPHIGMRDLLLARGQRANRSGGRLAGRGSREDKPQLVSA